MLWNSSYKTGIDEIDKQNNELINNIVTIMYSANNRTRLMQFEIFEELVKKYFEREQKLHIDCCYSDAYRHRIAHEVYIKKLQITKRNFEKTGATLENELILRTNMIEVHKNHIMCYDKSFAYFYFNNLSCENIVPNEIVYTVAAI